MTILTILLRSQYDLSNHIIKSTIYMYYTAIKYKYVFIFINHCGAAVTLTMLKSFFQFYDFKFESHVTSEHMSYASRKRYCREN